MIVGSAAAAMAAPTTLLDWELSNGEIKSLKVNSDGDKKTWYAVGGTGRTVVNSAGVWKGSVLNSNSSVINAGDEVAISTSIKISPSNAQNEMKGVNFYLTTLPSTSTVGDVESYDTPVDAPELGVGGYNMANAGALGFTIEAKANEGFLISSTAGTTAGTFGLIKFSDLGLSFDSGSPVEVDLDAKFSATMGDDGLFDVLVTLNSGDQSATWRGSDMDFGINQGDELYFQMTNTSSKWGDVKLDNLTVSIPEPATFGLFGLAVAGLTAYRRRKQL